MESEFNPFASPSNEPVTEIPVAAEVLGWDSNAYPMPVLPLIFRPSAMSLIIMIPLGIFMASVTCLFFFHPEAQSENPVGIAVVSLACACLTAIPAFGCLMVLRCKIVVKESCIEKIDFPKQVFLFTQVQSWHHHQITKTVYISLLGSDDYLPISNWAMSKEHNEVLGTVMRGKVGPPSG